MRTRSRIGAALGGLTWLAVAGCSLHGRTVAPRVTDQDLRRIEHVVVLFGENRSFDNLYGLFPGADGVLQAPSSATTQVDRDGTPLPTLPPVWKGRPPVADGDYGAALPNRPFRIDLPPVGKSLDVRTRDLVHRFYQNQEQIHGGRNDAFVAYGDAGALVMGYYDGASLPMWRLAREFTLADHFFMGAFGGSFLNHFWLVCACTPKFADAPAAMRAELGPDGRLALAASTSALDGPPQWKHDGAVTPDGYAVNTAQSSYQPSGIPPAPGGDPTLADPAQHPLPPQDDATIGDRLSAKGVSWAWYAGSWNAALADGAQDPAAERRVIYADGEGQPNFQPHHQPFNAFRSFAPGTAARREHLRDLADFEAAIDAGTLPAVSFYKPQGTLNEHPGYADVRTGDEHLAALVRRIQAGPQWKSTLIVVTYDENGGFWDHVPPPRGDRWGPGTRIPAIVVSPFARRGFVDHTPMDTTSILKLITRRFALEPLPGVRPAAGDLTSALEFR